MTATVSVGDQILGLLLVMMPGLLAGDVAMVSPR